MNKLKIILTAVGAFLMLSACFEKLVYLEDNRETPIAPEYTLEIADITRPSSKTDLRTIEKLDYGHEYTLALYSENKDAVFIIEIADSSVVDIESTSDISWKISGIKPGQTDMVLYIRDCENNEFEIKHTLVVYGHITLEAEYFSPASLGGFSVVDNPFDNLKGRISLSAFLVGNTYRMDQEVETRETQSVNVHSNINDRNNSSILDASEQASDIRSIKVRYDNETVYYNVVEARLVFVFTLDDPYIIIDDIVDDLDRDEQKYSDCAILATFQQEGLREFSEEEADESANGADSWVVNEVNVEL